MSGAALYVAGLGLFAMAGGMIGVMLGGGVLIGVALACTASAISLAVGARAVPAKQRSFVLGAITATGSLGALLSAPLGQMLTTDFGWRAGLLGFLALTVFMLPAAWIAGRVDQADAAHAGDRRHQRRLAASGAQRPRCAIRRSW